MLPSLPPSRAAPRKGESSGTHYFSAVFSHRRRIFFAKAAEPSGSRAERDGRAPVTGCGALVYHKSDFPTNKVTLRK